MRYFIISIFIIRLKFIVEHGNDNSVNFLDVRVILDEGCIKFDIYKKTYELKYLSYKLSHPIRHKRRIIIGQLDRILFLSHPEYHKKNIESMINILLIGYSLDIIFSTIIELKIS